MPLPYYALPESAARPTAAMVDLPGVFETETRRGELFLYFQSANRKWSSIFHKTRLEGLQDAIDGLLEISRLAAVESHSASSATEGASAPPFLSPFDSLKAEACRIYCSRHRTPAAALTGPSPYSSTWEWFQEAFSAPLWSSDYTSALFDKIIVPMTNTRISVDLGKRIEVQLSHEEARQWTPLPPPPDGTTPLTTSLTAVRFEEQELALTIIQGVSLCMLDHRARFAEHCFLHYATEVLQCYLQHVTAKYLEGRRKTKQNPPLPGSAGSPSSDDGPLRVMVRLVHAVEAVCHYNPPCLHRLIQAGGVKALLDTLYSPLVPSVLRQAVLDSISVLLQEVLPCRDVGAERGDEATTSVDPSTKEALLPWILQQGLEGASDGPSGAFRVDYPSAAKLGAAVQTWFRDNGLSHVLSAVIHLRQEDPLPLQRFWEAVESREGEQGTPLTVEHLLKMFQRTHQRWQEKLDAILQMIDGQRVPMEL